MTNVPIIFVLAGGTQDFESFKGLYQPVNFRYRYLHHAEQIYGIANPMVIILDGARRNHEYENIMKLINSNMRTI